MITWQQVQIEMLEVQAETCEAAEAACRKLDGIFTSKGELAQQETYLDMVGVKVSNLRKEAEKLRERTKDASVGRRVESDDSALPDQPAARSKGEAQQREGRVDGGRPRAASERHVGGER